MNRLVIIGAGGHGRVIADLAMKLGYTDIRFLDDAPRESWLNCPVAGTTEAVPSLNDGSTDFIIGIGSSTIRRRIAERFDVPWTTLVHPSAQLAADVTLGPGSVVMAGAVINASARAGAHCIINSGAIIEHDNVLGDYVHISPGTVLGGTVCVGEETHVGLGACVRNNITICARCTIGAGAAVVKDIRDEGTYIGVPARKML